MDEVRQALLEKVSFEEFGFRLDKDALGRIDRFLQLLELWNRRLRLTGERDPSTLVQKHVVDSLSCVPLLPQVGNVLDLGTGAGFPGAVLACVRPDLETVLLDARERPVSFLREVVRTAPLEHTRAIAMRGEDAATDSGMVGRQAVVTSRALRMEAFFPLAKPLLAPGGIAVSMQTPRVDVPTASAIAARYGLRLVELRDYRLPNGDPRRLVVCG